MTAAESVEFGIVDRIVERRTKDEDETPADEDKKSE
jgi:ATP-dependent protease ClpP protease subunit